MDMTWSGHQRIGAAAVSIAALAALAGCSAIAPLTDQISAGAHELVEASTLAPLGVNPSSPIAADALRAERTEGPTPSFATVPPKPSDVRAPPAYRSEVLTLVNEKRGLNRWAATNPPGVVDATVSERYADLQRDRVGHEAPVAPEQKGDTETFATKRRQAVGQTDAPPPARSPN